MRFVKLAVISFVVIAGIIMAITAMIPSTVNILRTVNLPVSKDSAISRLNDFNDWKSWNLFVSNPSLTNLTITENQISADQLTISRTDLRNDSLITSWAQPNGKKFDGGLVFYGDDKVTVVQWYFTISVKWYPWEKVASMMFEKQLGPMMEESLNRLSGNSIR